MPLNKKNHKSRYRMDDETAKLIGLSLNKCRRYQLDPEKEIRYFDFLEKKEKQSNSKLKKKLKEWKENVKDGTAHFEGSAELESDPTIDDAIRISGANMEVWEVKDWEFRYWDVHMKVQTPVNVGPNKHLYREDVIGKRNYYIKIKYQKIQEDAEQIISNIINEALSIIPTVKPKKKTKTKNIGVVSFADFHLGAEITDLIKTPDFSIEILIETLSRVADTINELKFNEIYVNMLGDYFESLSGLNHLNTFKSLAKKGYGGSVIKLGGVIFSDFLGKIHNLKRVNMVAGNHDRITPKADIDNEGAGAEILSHILELKLPTVEVNFHPYLIADTIDGVCYILTHGNFGINGKPIGDIVTKYGKQGIYNLWLEGHKHSRKSHKVWFKTPIYVFETPLIAVDELDYRKYMVGSVFTGNYYSETLGYTTNGGFLCTTNNGKGKLNVFDYSI